ncbi:MAG: SdrD B-like domain-containing protein, partial [Peptostreptococcaceae bacterium]
LDSEIVNTVNLNINSQYRDTASKTLDIGNSSYGAYINNYGPNHGKIGNSASFEITVGNYGNQDLIPVSIVNNIPDEVDIYRVATGSWMIDVIHVLIPQAYSIEYEINNSGTFVLLGNYNTSNSVYVNMPVLQVNEKITKLRWNIANFPVGTISEKPIIIDGIINTQSTENEFLNVSSITWTDGTGESSVQAVHRTFEDNKSELNIKKTVLNGVTTVVPYQIIRYKISFNGYGSQVNNPIISDLLSEKIEYIGNEKYTYYDYFSNTTINSNDSNFYDEVPINLEIINNFNDSINTLIRYDMDGFSLRQKGNFSVEFDVRVKPGATGNIINNATLGNKGNNGVVAGGYASYLDIDDRDGDGITNESLARSNNISNSIAYYAYLLSDKKVKGELNDYFIEEPLVGKTYQGGKVSYKIVIQNLGNLNFEYIEVVDILPHIGDKGVILENESRNSQFNIYNIKGVTAKIIEDDEVIKETKCKVEYSKSYNPIRFSKNDFGNTTIGVDNDWTETAPIVISDIKSIKISTLDVILLPNQLIEIDITCLAPVGVNQNLVAWNSFAVKCSYRNENGILTQMIPVEPEKVGVEILNSNKASIGGFTWLDKNKDGYFNNGDIRENGIIVQLLNENNILLNETMTVNNENNLEGYYIFNNIELGNYYIKFIRPNNFYFTKKVDNGDSSADIATGITDIINIQSLGQHIDNINCGFINQISISDLLIELLNYDIYSLNCET